MGPYLLMRLSSQAAVASVAGDLVTTTVQIRRTVDATLQVRRTVAETVER